MMNNQLSVARDFSRYPAGRYKSDGPFSGERFRDELLVPAINSGARITIDLDGVRGFGSSFLEEAFGGLVRVGYQPELILQAFELESQDPSLIMEIKEYILNARNGTVR